MNRRQGRGRRGGAGTPCDPRPTARVGSDRQASVPRRLPWVEVHGAAAILIRTQGAASLIRYASSNNRKSGYHWVATAFVHRRPEWDANPEPTWFQQARVSPRPPRVLWSLLHDDHLTTAPDPMFDTDADGRPL
jgi:hypothetical protein